MKTFYICYTNVHSVMLSKDNGMLPQFMKVLGLYEAYYVSYIPAETEDDHVQRAKQSGLHLIHLDHKFTKNEEFTWHSPVLRTQTDMLKFIWKNATKMDVLNLYFIKTSFLYALTYKIRNPHGKCYIKADVNVCDLPSPEKLTGRIKLFLFDLYLSTIPSLITVESTYALKVFRQRFPLSAKKTKYLPNGVDDRVIKDIVPKQYCDKENLIITVGRIGTKQKNTEFLLDACSKVEWKDDWKLVAIGHVDDAFKPKIQEFFSSNPELKNRIEFIGVVNNREEIFDLYNRAKIFCLTSTPESFGIAYIEAQSMGDYIVSTPVDPIVDIIPDEKYGLVCDSADKMASTLSHLMQDERTIEQNHDDRIAHASMFFMSNIYAHLGEMLNEV